MRTSLSDPLQIAGITASGRGTIGVTLCPGKYQPNAATGGWDRNLQIDLDAIRAWGARLVVTLVTPAELVALRVEALGEEVTARGMLWSHLPIEDFDIPTADWELAWDKLNGGFHRLLDANGRMLIHCKGGLGRAGLVAARLLVERGIPAGQAISHVRRRRPGAIETEEQKAYLLHLDRFSIRHADETTLFS